MTILNITDASRLAGVSRQELIEKINAGALKRKPEGVELSELIGAFPILKPIANVKLRDVKKIVGTALVPTETKNIAESSNNMAADADIVLDQDAENQADQTLKLSSSSSAEPSETVELLIRELEWNKELLEQTNQQMAKQMAKQQAMIADQARRLDEKDRFWARQVEIAQSMLAAPVEPKRKKLFGLF